MNTRLQVEHPVTEMITGLDLVCEQIRVASGSPLSFTQEEVQPRGHAIEVRICAEDPETFLPSPGRIEKCRHPQGPFVRVDSYAYPDFEIPIHYDPMLAKLISWGRTREEAINRLQRALAEFCLTGIKTNMVFLRSLLKEPAFLDGSYTTQFIDKDFKRPENLFHFIDDRAFLVAASIRAYQRLKDQALKGSPSVWKRTTRMQSVQPPFLGGR